MLTAAFYFGIKNIIDIWASNIKLVIQFFFFSYVCLLANPLYYNNDIMSSVKKKQMG